MCGRVGENSIFNASGQGAWLLSRYSIIQRTLRTGGEVRCSFDTTGSFGGGGEAEGTIASKRLEYLEYDNNHQKYFNDHRYNQNA